MSALMPLHLLIGVLIGLPAIVLLVAQCLLSVVIRRTAKTSPSIEARAHALTVVLPRYTLVIEGSTSVMLLLNIPGVAFSAMPWQQVVTTLSGKALMLETLLLISMFILGIIISSMFHPRLNSELHKYRYVQKRYQNAYMSPVAKQKINSLEQQLQLRTERLSEKVRRIIYLVRLTFVVAVGVVVCASVMTVVAVMPSSPTKAVQSNTPRTAMSPFVKTVLTIDNQYRITLTVTPNHFGANEFIVSIMNDTTDTPVTNVHVSLALTMLDMNMGTDTLTLQTDGKGQLSGKGNFSMAGNWQIVIVVRTSDAKLHQATVVLWTI